MQTKRIARTAHERVKETFDFIDMAFDDGVIDSLERREYERRKRETLATTGAADSLDALSMAVKRASSERHLNGLTEMARRAWDELPDVA